MTSNLNCTPKSSSTLISISDKYALNKDVIIEGQNYIILPNIIAYLLISIYGIDIVLKTKRKHLFNICQDDENCSYCTNLWSISNPNSFNVISMYRTFQEYYLKTEEVVKSKETIQKTSSDSSSSSGDVITKYEKRFLFRFFSC